MGLNPKVPLPTLPGLPKSTELEIQQIQTVTSLTAGPLPDPKALAEYEKIKPGFAERIMTMAEQQASHRRELEAQINKAQVSDILAERVERRRGQYIGAAVVGGTLVLAAIIGTLGQGPWAASVIGGVPLTGLVIAFIAGRAKPVNGKSNNKK